MSGVLRITSLETGCKGLSVARWQLVAASDGHATLARRLGSQGTGYDLLEFIATWMRSQRRTTIGSISETWFAPLLDGPQQELQPDKTPPTRAPTNNVELS
jgi:hypothetical protein